MSICNMVIIMYTTVLDLVTEFCAKCYFLSSQNPLAVAVKNANADIVTL